MKTKEEVLIKLGKQTKKVNVDLALIDDIYKENIRLVQWYDKVVNQSKELASELERISSLYEKNTKLASEGMKKALELGADDIYKKLLDNKNISEKYSKESSSKAKKIYSL